MTVAGDLATLLDQATPGPWEHRGLAVWGGDRSYPWEIAQFALQTSARDFDLIALAPDMARLLVDTFGKYAHQFDDETLARFAALDEKAGGA